MSPNNLCCDDERQETDMSGLLDRHGKLSLMYRANTASASSNNLSPLGNITAKHFTIGKPRIFFFFAEITFFGYRYNFSPSDRYCFFHNFDKFIIILNLLKDYNF